MPPSPRTTEDIFISEIHWDRLTYKTEHQEYIIVEAVRANESFKEADFVLYEADTDEAVYHILQGVQIFAARPLYCELLHYLRPGIDMGISDFIYNGLQLFHLHLGQLLQQL